MSIERNKKRSTNRKEEGEKDESVFGWSKVIRVTKKHGLGVKEGCLQVGLRNIEDSQ